MTTARTSDEARAQVARRAAGSDTEAPSLATLVERLKPEMARALPTHMNADRMARLALTVLRKTPGLNACTPESFLGALMTCSQLGIEPGATGEAYLVPHKNRKTGTVECTLIIGYQGYAKLFWQSPQAKHLDAQAVFENDEFQYELGLEPKLIHRPAIGNRGKVVAFYAVATLTSGGSAFVVLSPEDCKKIRGTSGPNGGIADPMYWMEKKTALRQLVKLMPKSSQLATAVIHDGGVRRDAEQSALERGPDMVNAEVLGEDTPVIEAEPVDDLDYDPETGEVITFSGESA